MATKYLSRREAKGQFKARDQARKLANKNMERRLRELNQLRSEVTQDRGNFVSRIEFDADLKDSNRRLDSLERFQARLVGIGIIIAILCGVIGAAAGKLIFGGQ